MYYPGPYIVQGESRCVLVDNVEVCVTLKVGPVCSFRGIGSLWGFAGKPT